MAAKKMDRLINEGIYNVDEIGIQTKTYNAPKVLSTKGKKQVRIVCWKTKTYICCCNAEGSFLPPLMIFTSKRMLLDGSPSDT